MTQQVNTERRREEKRKEKKTKILEMVNYLSCFFSIVKLIPLSIYSKDLDQSTTQFKISSVPFIFFGVSYRYRIHRC